MLIPIYVLWYLFIPFMMSFSWINFLHYFISDSCNFSLIFLIRQNYYWEKGGKTSILMICCNSLISYTPIYMTRIFWHEINTCKWFLIAWYVTEHGNRQISAAITINDQRPSHETFPKTNIYHTNQPKDQNHSGNKFFICHEILNYNLGMILISWNVLHVYYYYSCEKKLLIQFCLIYLLFTLLSFSTLPS